MNDASLRTFLAIIETGSLVRASEALHVTQSTVTARLQTLEEELGQPLIVRRKSGATLTPAGVRLERYAVTITDLWGQARQETALPDGFSGVCNIACEPDLWPGLGDRFYRSLLTNHPQLAISVWRGSQSEVADWMAGGKSDLAITTRAAFGAHQEQIALPPDRLVLVSDRPDRPIRFDPGYVFVEAGEEFGRAHAAEFADAGTASLTFGDARLGLEHLLSEGGSAYLPARMANPHIATNRLFQLPNAPEFSRRVFLTVNTSARQAWEWFDDSVAGITEV